jgi:uncharacterized protein with FMN-binding domain
MKEIIYTAVFVALGVILIILLAFMFIPKKEKAVDSKQQYTPGIYTSTVTLNSTNLEVEVVVDSTHINAIRISNLDETVATMYPLVQPTVEYIAEQIYENQSLEDISYNEDSPYTSQIIIHAIEDALLKGKVE